VHLCQKVPFDLACFQTSAAPRPEHSDPQGKDELFDLDTQITYCTEDTVAILLILIFFCITVHNSIKIVAK
jgi:hypothetical protein